VYIDDDDNVIFRDIFLDEVAITVPLLQQNTDHSTSTPKSLASLVKDMVCQKFVDKKHNPNQWIELFEKEATRINILRLFLDGSAEDWYDISMKTIGFR